MARARSPDRDKAFNIWLDSKGEILLKDIANQLGVSDGQIRKWKNLDKWHDKLKGNVTNEKVQSKSNVTFENVDAKKQNKKITKKLIESVEENEDLTEKQKLFCIWCISF
jgi:phage terminase small subunit